MSTWWLGADLHGEVREEECYLFLVEEMRRNGRRIEMRGKSATRYRQWWGGIEESMAREILYAMRWRRAVRLGVEYGGWRVLAPVALRMADALSPPVDLIGCDLAGQWHCIAGRSIWDIVVLSHSSAPGAALAEEFAHPEETLAYLALAGELVR